MLLQIPTSSPCRLWTLSVQHQISDVTSKRVSLHFVICKMGRKSDMNSWTRTVEIQQHVLPLFLVWNSSYSCRFGLCHRQRCCVVRIWGLLWKCRHGHDDQKKSVKWSLRYNTQYKLNMITQATPNQIEVQVHHISKSLIFDVWKGFKKASLLRLWESALKRCSTNCIPEISIRLQKWNCETANAHFA